MPSPSRSPNEAKPPTPASQPRFNAKTWVTSVWTIKRRKSPLERGGSVTASVGYWLTVQLSVYASLAEGTEVAGVAQGSSSAAGLGYPVSGIAAASSEAAASGDAAGLAAGLACALAAVCHSGGPGPGIRTAVPAYPAGHHHLAASVAVEPVAALAGAIVSADAAASWPPQSRNAASVWLRASGYAASPRSVWHRWRRSSTAAVRGHPGDPSVSSCGSHS